MAVKAVTFWLVLHLASFLLTIPVSGSSDQAIFINKDTLRKAIEKRQADSKDQSADVMVQNILKWLQTVYGETNRKPRQGGNRDYLPPVNTEKPRPFQTGGPYAPSGSIRPSPGFPDNGPSTPFNRPTYGPTTGGPDFGITDNSISSQTNPSPSNPEVSGSLTNTNLIPSPSAINQLPGTLPDDDLNHPPHIHALDVKCSKEQMIVELEFNREFNGIIYSKGFYTNPACRYVNENSGQTKYTFTLSLNNCGTEFISAFETEGQSYLENVLVLQNELGIQEQWDTIRAVRCLWEGNINQALSVSLSVDMLTQEIVTFSGDTAVAKLDIQVGRGPFAPQANGLVKIGEIMTLVVSISGDPDFDIQVRDCVARDQTGDNKVALTDTNGCVLKPKLFGAFQKTKDTQNTGASIIAYAYFSAFKFPDIMDLILECNIELCKTDCQVCPDPNQKTEPGKRKRRSLTDLTGNSTKYDSMTYRLKRSQEENSDPVKVAYGIRVIMPEDIQGDEAIEAEKNSLVFNLGSKHPSDSVCISVFSFLISGTTLVLLLISSSLFSATIWLKYQKLKNKY